MLTPEERALATHFADRLIDLYSERDAALDVGDLARLHAVAHEPVIRATELRGQGLPPKRPFRGTRS